MFKKNSWIKSYYIFILKLLYLIYFKHKFNQIYIKGSFTREDWSLLYSDIDIVFIKKNLTTHFSKMDFYLIKFFIPHFYHFDVFDELFFTNYLKDNISDYLLDFSTWLNVLNKEKIIPQQKINLNLSTLMLFFYRYQELNEFSLKNSPASIKWKKIQLKKEQLLLQVFSIRRNEIDKFYELMSQFFVKRVSHIISVDFGALKEKKLEKFFSLMLFHYHSCAIYGPAPTEYEIYIKNRILGKSVLPPKLSLIDFKLKFLDDKLQISYQKISDDKLSDELRLFCHYFNKNIIHSKSI